MSGVPITHAELMAFANSIDPAITFDDGRDCFGDPCAVATGKHGTLSLKAGARFSDGTPAVGIDGREGAYGGFGMYSGDAAEVVRVVGRCSERYGLRGLQPRLF